MTFPEIGTLKSIGKFFSLRVFVTMKNFRFPTSKNKIYQFQLNFKKKNNFFVLILFCDQCKITITTMTKKLFLFILLNSCFPKSRLINVLLIFLEERVPFLYLPVWWFDLFCLLQWYWYRLMLPWSLQEQLLQPDWLHLVQHRQNHIC